MLRTQRPRATFGLMMLCAGCASQPIAQTNDCPTAPVPEPQVASTPRSDPQRDPRAAGSSRGVLRDRNGLALSATNGGTPSSLRPWIGSLTDKPTGSSGLQARFDSELGQGKDVQVSLDATLHVALEAAFSDVERGSGVVLDIPNGGLLALFSTLPHTTQPGLEQRHLATSRAGECGSTAKPFTALLALRSGVSKPETTYECTGGVKLGKQEFRCWGEHGAMDLSRALAISDNVYFYQLARLLKHDAIANTQHAFGLGEPVEVFPNAPRGWVPSREALEGDGKNFSQASTLTQAIGHGIAVTPLQMARAYAALASAELPQPSFGHPSLSATKVNDEWVEFLPVIRAALRRAVTDEEGTAHVAGSPADVAGKTGTAQAAVTPGDPAPPVTGWFAGWAPADTPRVAFAFRAEGLTGREVASRIVKVMEAAGNR